MTYLWFVPIYVSSILALNTKYNAIFDYIVILSTAATSVFIASIVIRKNILTATEVFLSATCLLFFACAALSTGQLTTHMFVAFLGCALLSSKIMFGTGARGRKALSRAGPVVFFVFTFFVLISVFEAGFRFNRYEGWFDNPNSLALFCLPACLFSAGVISQRRLLKREAVLSFAFFLATFFLILSTQSRAALLAVFVAIFFLLVTSKDLSTVLFRWLKIALIIGAFIALSAPQTIFYLTEKFQANLAKGDISSGRFDAWLIILKNVNFFGHGAGYENRMGLVKDGVWGHSVYIETLALSGLFAFLAIISVLVFLWIRLLRARRRECLAAICGFPVITGYIVSSIFLPQPSAPSLWLGLVLWGVAEGNTRRRLGSSCYPD